MKDGCDRTDDRMVEMKTKRAGKLKDGAQCKVSGGLEH